MKERYNFLDLLRGLAVINMVIYHFVWDLVYFGFNIPWYNSQVGFIWQQYISWSFIFISGFSFHLGSEQLKRGMEIFLLGLVVTLLTLFFVPQNKVLFGILTLIGSCNIIVYFTKDILKKYNMYIGAFSSFVLFMVTKDIAMRKIISLQIPSYFYKNLFTAYLGFPMKSFYSTDYFPLLPWIFLFVCGFFVFMIFEKNNYFEKLDNVKCTAIEYVGKKALPIYMIHQVVLYAIAYVVAMLLRK